MVATGSDPRHPAAEAVALFVYRIVREAGAMAAALGGVDAIMFTAGIGENDAALRAEVAAGCRCLGRELVDALNRQARGRISAAGSRGSRPGSCPSTRNG